MQAHNVEPFLKYQQLKSHLQEPECETNSPATGYNAAPGVKQMRLEQLENATHFSNQETANLNTVLVEFIGFGSHFLGHYHLL